MPTATTSPARTGAFFLFSDQAVHAWFQEWRTLSVEHYLLYAEQAAQESAVHFYKSANNFDAQLGRQQGPVSKKLKRTAGFPLQPLNMLMLSAAVSGLRN